MAIPEPRPADALIGYGRQPEIARPMERVQAGEPGADDQDVERFARFAVRAGRFMPIVLGLRAPSATKRLVNVASPVRP
jgi:hypothetical protein